MNFRPRIAGCALPVLIVLLPFVAQPQTLIITNGVRTYAGLTNTTVTLTGHSELRVTGANNPIPGCQINLNSSDSWFVLSNVRPATVLTGCLGQVKVNGAAAVSAGNVRVDQFDMGSVIIPQSPAFTPLQIFSGPNFLGPSAQLGLYTYYTNTALGAMDRNIGSFKLKRGYSVTFAQNANGTGASRVFVAQDGDLDVGVMPVNLAYACSFVRVFPLRWTARKGWDDTAGESAIIKPFWFYDWGSGRTSSMNAEYVPMKWGGGGSYSSFNGKQKSTHMLGFNEPDKSDQANMSVAAAIAEWPNLMQSGLRLGAPAVSDSATTGTGLDWLYSFMSQADALGYRVDFIPIHFYKCGWTAMQLSNYLAGVWQNTGRPVWVTEFNYGANWCAGTPPTPEQEATAVSQFLDVLENAPFVERYSIYNWVGTNRAMVLDNGDLTPAGLIYRDRPSALAYTQTLPPGGSRGIAQFHFENDTLDSSGYGNNGFSVGIPGYTAGHAGRAVTLDGTNNFIQLPPNVASGASFSFAAWIRWDGGGNWQRIFDFGNDTGHYLFLTPFSGSDTLRFAIRNGGSEQLVETAPLPAGQWRHVAVTLSGGNARLYTNGVLAASGAFTIAPSNFNPAKNYFGKSQFAVDPLFRGALDEVQIADYAFTPAQIAALQTNQPPQFVTNFFAFGTAASGQPYTTNLFDTATDPDPGDALAYSKAGGRAWLTIAPDGTLSGTPGPADGGTNYFTVRVTDSAGASGFAVVTLCVPTVYSTGTWSADADGNWSDNSKWSGGLIASGAGFTADFGTINITADRTVTLDSSRSIGTLKFGDTFGAHDWTVASSNASALTLDSGSSSAPSIAVNQNTATLAAPLAGGDGFAKTGPGALVLGDANSLSGAIYIDTSSTTVNEGVVRAAHPGALSGITNIFIRNNNGGSSTLQLDGSSGNIIVPGRLTVSCRNNGVATIQNLAGTNTLAGFVALDVGGSMFNIRSDSGLLIFSGTNQYVGSLVGGRSYVFSGAGDHLVAGPIRNSTNGSPIGLAKSGAGTLTLAAVNTYTNTTTVTGGMLLVNGVIGPGAVNVSSATLGGNGTISGAVTAQSGATLAPGAGIGRLTVNNSVTLQVGSATRMEISKAPFTNDQLHVTGTLNRDGALIVTNLGGALAAGDAFTLFQAGAFAGAFASYSLPPLNPGLAWDTNALGSGVLSVVQMVATNPTDITTVVAADRSGLTVSWPGDHTGWRLETNAAGLTRSDSWFTLEGSMDTNEVFLPFDPASSNVFFRLVFP